MEPPHNHLSSGQTGAGPQEQPCQLRPGSVSSKPCAEMPMGRCKIHGGECQRVGCPTGISSSQPLLLNPASLLQCSPCSPAPCSRMLPCTRCSPKALAAWEIREDFMVLQRSFGGWVLGGRPVAPPAGPHGWHQQERLLGKQMLRTPVFLSRSPRSAHIKPERNNYQKGKLRAIPCYPPRSVLVLP